MCGLPLMLGKAMFTISCAVLPERARSKLYPFVRPTRQRRLAWESRVVVRWLMWNMPLHAAHHVHPAVPFHAVPRAHELLAPQLEHESRGYLAFHREALARAFGRAPG